MFLNFYPMREEPFGVTPDPRYLYFGKSHREALASLFYGIEADRGFMALIAQPGLGKTTLTFQLLEKLRRTARTVLLFQTQCNSRELFQYLLNDLGVDTTGMDIVSMNSRLNAILLQEKMAGRRFILAVDEAQNLDSQVLETIRLLSNFQTHSSKLLQIVLIGQPQLARTLASPSLAQLQQRISIFARLEPFDFRETAAYIAHRLQVAGYTGNELFAPEALQMIHDCSQGVPRNINSLCFSALSLAYAMGRKRIDSGIMREVIADQEIASLNKSLAPPRPALASAREERVLSYPRLTSKQGLPSWALGAAAAVAFLAVGLAIHPFLSRQIGRHWQPRNIVLASAPKIETSTRGSARSADVSEPIRAPVEIPGVSAVAPPGSNGDVATNTIVVQPGDTLLQIASRTLPQSSRRTIQEIQNLNPSITNPNHIEVGQKLKLPSTSLPVGSAQDRTGKNAAGTNGASRRRK